MTINTSSLGGGGLPRLAPDLTWPSSKAIGLVGYTTISGINGTTGGLVTVLSLSGKYAVSLIRLTSLVSESITLKLTVDGVVIWNNTFALGAINFLAVGDGDGANTYEAAVPTQSNSTFLLEITTITANSITCNYIAKPTL